MRKFTVALVSIAGFFGLTSTASAEDSDPSIWSITPYIWAPNTSLDLTFRDTNIGSGDVSFGDLLDTLDAAFMLQVEAGKGNWSAFGDLTYFRTSDTTERTAVTINADSTQTFLDLALAYSPGGVGSRFNVFGGLRLSEFHDRYEFRSALDGSLVSSQPLVRDYYDALVGLRYRIDLTERWALLTHGDVSFGNSEGTFLVRANFAYTVGKRKQNRILLGYQYKQAKFKDGDLVTDFSYNGAMVGFNFQF